MKEIRRRLQQGETCLGLYVRIPCPDIVELAKGAGYDFVRLDCEHALMSLSEIREMLSAARRAGMPCQIRIAPELPITALLGQEPAGARRDYGRHRAGRSVPGVGRQRAQG